MKHYKNGKEEKMHAVLWSHFVLIKKEPITAEITDTNIHI